MPERPVTLLAALVHRDERTHEEQVAAFERCARQNGESATLSLRTFRRWLAGDIQTMPRPVQRRVARLHWGFAMDQLLAPPPPEVHVSPGPASGLADVGEDFTDSCGRGATEPLDFDDARNELERQVAMSSRRAAQFTAFAEAQNVGSETVDQLHENVASLAQDYLREPLISIMPDLAQTQDIIFTLLEGKQKPGHAADLYLLAGAVSGLLAKASQDIGHLRHAMTQARTAFACAENANHNGLRGWARALQSLIAYWGGRYQEAAQYAQRGAAFAQEPIGSIAVWLPALEARAWAAVSNSDEAIRALREVEQRRTEHRSSDLDALGGLFTFSEAKQHYYSAGAYVFLPDQGSNAEREALASLHQYERGPAEGRSFSDEAGARAELALARVRAGEVEGARDAFAPVLSLGPERRIGGIVTSAGRVHQALSTPTFGSSVAASSFRDEIESFCRLPASLSL